jgi:hypothetical protein
MIGKDILDYFQYLSWIVNQEKSQLSPCKQFTFLGLSLDSEKIKVVLTEERLKKYLLITKKKHVNRVIIPRCYQTDI